MSVSQTDVRKVQELVASALGPPNGWAKWAGGWPGDIESALVDAVFSARAVYATKNKRGILALVETWRGERLRTSYDLTALESEIAGDGPLVWAKRFGSSQHSPSRPATAPGSPWVRRRLSRFDLRGTGWSRLRAVCTISTAM
jgi:hypothetical protein